MLLHDSSSKEPTARRETRDRDCSSTISTEALIPIREVPKYLPPRSSGKSCHISVIYRWVTRGVRGVVLESWVIGGLRYSSLQALDRFIARCSSGEQHVATSRAEERHRRRVSRDVQVLLKQGNTGTQSDGASS